MANLYRSCRSIEVGLDWIGLFWIGLAWIDGERVYSRSSIDYQVYSSWSVSQSCTQYMTTHSLTHTHTHQLSIQWLVVVFITPQNERVSETFEVRVVGIQRRARSLFVRLSCFVASSLVPRTHTRTDRHTYIPTHPLSHDRQTPTHDSRAGAVVAPSPSPSPADQDRIGF